MTIDRNIWTQMREGKDSLWKEDCPFCKDDEYLIKKFDFWNIYQNKYPYLWEQRHLLLTPIRHIEHTKELHIDELSELPKIEAFIEAYYSGENYFSFIRQTNDGKTIKHLHYHYLPWILYSKNMEDILKNNKKNIWKT